MSVSMLKRAKDGSIPDEWIAIATNSVFEEQWLPLARQLNLQLVPRMWDPLHLIEEERLVLLKELEQMRTFVDRIEGSASEAIAKRIRILVAALQSGSCEVYEFGFG